MKKKVLYGVALTLFASVSVVSLQSCKDDLNDLATQTTFDLSNLQKQINALDAYAKGLKAEIDQKANAADLVEYAKLSYVNDLLTTINGRLDALEGKPSSSPYDDTELRNLYNQLNGAVTSLQNDIKNKVDASELKTQLDALKAELQKDYNDKFKDVQDSQEALKQELKGEIEANKNAIEALDTYLKENYYNAEETDALFDQVYQELTEARELISQVYNALNDRIDEVDAKVDETVNAMIEAINNIVNSIVNQIDHQVTGILIQSVKSPVFGDFSLPIGIKSNILFNWYGYNGVDMDIVFPSSENNSEFAAYGDPSNLAKMTPKKTVTIPAGVYGDVELGEVYVTLNPVGSNFENLELSIENSAGDRLPMKVTLESTDEVLYHGYSRSVDNGFYKGKVVLPEAGIPAARVTIDEGLKTAMKDALKDRTKRSAVALVKALYDQMSGMLPAYALRYDWATGTIPSISLEEGSLDPGHSVKAQAVLSQYDLAVATAKPLSFNFLAGKSVSKKLPVLSPMQNLILKLKEDGDLQLNLKNINIQYNDIVFGKLTLSAGDVSVSGGEITITLPDIIVKDGEKELTVEYEKTVQVKSDDLESVYTAIEDGIKQAFENAQAQVDSWTGEMQDQINGELKSIINQVQNQVNNELIGNINQQIEDMIDNVGHKFDGVFNKINRVFDIYNKIANKVNNVLDDPNAYLQVTALYNMNGSYGFVSGSVNHPTTFKAAGGNAFKLYLTSYTGELIVPAYKKYVAITGVYKNGQEVTADLAALNEAEDLNTVLDGSRIGVLVPAKNLVAGNVYEFTYQAIDYNGKTSTRKFYIEVNN